MLVSLSGKEVQSTLIRETDRTSLIRYLLGLALATLVDYELRKTQLFRQNFKPSIKSLEIEIT